MSCWKLNFYCTNYIATLSFNLFVYNNAYVVLIKKYFNKNL